MRSYHLSFFIGRVQDDRTNSVFIDEIVLDFMVVHFGVLFIHHFLLCDHLPFIIQGYYRQNLRFIFHLIFDQFLLKMFPENHYRRQRMDSFNPIRDILFNNDWIPEITAHHSPIHRFFPENRNHFFIQRSYRNCLASWVFNDQNWFIFAI